MYIFIMHFYFSKYSHYGVRAVKMTSTVCTVKICCQDDKCSLYIRWKYAVKMASTTCGVNIVKRLVQPIRCTYYQNDKYCLCVENTVKMSSTVCTASTVKICCQNYSTWCKYCQMSSTAYTVHHKYTVCTMYIFSKWLQPVLCTRYC